MTIDDIRAVLNRAHDRYFAILCTPDHRLAGRQKARAADKAIQVRHDSHVAGHRTQAAAAARQEAHRKRQADKAARRADPNVRATTFNQLAFRAAVKRQRWARVYPVNGAREVARRDRQIAAGQIQITGCVA